jgi:hypothetical protein
MGRTVGQVLDIRMEVPTRMFTLFREVRPGVGGGELVGSTRDEAAELIFLGLDSSWLPFVIMYIGFGVGPDAWRDVGAGFRNRRLYSEPKAGAIRAGSNNNGTNRGADIRYGKTRGNEARQNTLVNRGPSTRHSESDLGQARHDSGVDIGDNTRCGGACGWFHVRLNRRPAQWAIQRRGAGTRGRFHRGSTTWGDLVACGKSPCRAGVLLDTCNDGSYETLMGLGAAGGSTRGAKLGPNELKTRLADGSRGEAVDLETKGMPLGLTFGVV